MQPAGKNMANLKLKKLVRHWIKYLTQRQERIFCQGHFSKIYRHYMHTHIHTPRIITLLMVAGSIYCGVFLMYSPHRLTNAKC